MLGMVNHPSRTSPPRRWLAATAAAALVALVAVAGCSSDGADDAETAPSETARSTETAEAATSDATATDATDRASGDSTPAGAFPVTIEHALGTAVIESRPERVVVLSDFNDLDSVLALGVEPVAFGFTDAWGTGLAPWQLDAGAGDLAQIDATAEIDVEEVANADPDLIIGMEYLAEPIYEQLSALAPVVSLSFVDTWDEHLDIVARALGETENAAAIAAQVDNALASAAEQLADVADMPVMVGSYFSDQLYIQGEQSSVTNLLRALGLTVLTTTDEQMDAQSLENVTLLSDADIILSLATDATATTTAQESSLWTALPAVQAGRYSALTGSDARATSDNFNALSYRYAIDMLVGTVQQTAAGNGTPFTG